MQAALIPPIPHLEEAKGRKYHLVLAHLLLSNSTYMEFYKKEAENGAFIILDNSAHEMTSGQPIWTLLTLARQVGAKEIVMPDTLFDARETILGAFEAIMLLSSTAYIDQAQSYRYMFVPQGTTYKHWRECLDGLSLLIEGTNRTFPKILSKGITVGLSKDYETWPGGLYRLLNEDVIPWADQYNAQIHLLGWGRDLWALENISEWFGDRVRSVDSAKPYVYATQEIALNPKNGVIPEYPKRPVGYFEQPLSENRLEIARHNVQVFDQIAGNGVVK
jgi:hypothetical protein